MSDDDTGTKREHDGRSVHIDTGFYEVQVWGDPDDDLETVRETAEQAADRAKADVQELDDRIDDGNGGAEYA